MLEIGDLQAQPLLHRAIVMPWPSVQNPTRPASESTALDEWCPNVSPLPARKLVSRGVWVSALKRTVEIVDSILLCAGDQDEMSRDEEIEPPSKSRQRRKTTALGQHGFCCVPCPCLLHRPSITLARLFSIGPLIHDRFSVGSLRFLSTHTVL